MRQVLAIARREWRAFATSGMAPVIASGFLVLTGLFYYLFVRGYADTSEAMVQTGRWQFLNLHAGIFHKLYGDVVLFLLFLLPAVTMRLLSSEYRSGRYDLITSWPVSDRRWVLGKWLSAVLVALVLLAGTAFYFGLTMVLGRFADPAVAPEWQPLLTALVGLALMAGAVVAWGLFASALLSHQAAAYFLAFAISLGLFLVGQLEVFLPGALGQVAGALALGNHFLAFAGGVIDSRDVVYFLGITAVGLAATEAALAQRRLPAGRRVAPWLRVLVVLAVAIFLQLVAERRPLRVDLTPTRLYSLAPQTEQILRSLARPREGAGGQAEPLPRVTVTAYYQGLDGARQHMQALLRSFTDLTDRVSFEFVDPVAQPDAARAAGVNVPRTVIVAAADRRRILLEPDEGDLASAIYRTATGTQPVIYWVLGQGEARLDLEEAGGASLLDAVLADSGYDVRPLVVAQRGSIPDDAALVVWVGPKLEPAPAVLAALDAYLDRGGALLACFGPGTPDRVRQWTEDRYAVRQHGDVVVAPNRSSALAGVGLRTVVVSETYGEHPSVRRLQSVLTTFPFVQTLRYVPVPGREVDGQILLLTGPDTWGETDPDTKYTGAPSFDPREDRPGPKPFAVILDVPRPGGGEAAAAGEVSESGADDAAATDAAERPGRIIMVGSSAFVTNANIGLYGNRDLVLNLVGWLAAEEDLLGIRGRRASFQPLLLDTRTEEWLGAVSVLAWPALVGLGWFALVILRQRRH